MKSDKQPEKNPCLRLHLANGRLDREIQVEEWESAIARAILPGMLPEAIATIACAVTVEMLQGRTYFGRVHQNLFRDRAIYALAQTGNSDQLGETFSISGRRVRQIIQQRRKPR